MVSEIELDADEQIIYRVIRSKIGLWPAYGFMILVLIGVLVGVFLIARNQDAVSKTMPVALALLIVGAAAALLGLITYMYMQVYRGNKMIITNERVVLLTRSGVFHQTVPQLNLADVQEVSVKQHGIFSNLFNYGSVVIETAGEQKNIMLRYAHNPHQAAKQIDDASEAYERNIRHDVPRPPETPQPPTARG